jgi:hypothetical protein
MQTTTTLVTLEYIIYCRLTIYTRKLRELDNSILCLPLSSHDLGRLFIAAPGPLVLLVRALLSSVLGLGSKLVLLFSLPLRLLFICFSWCFALNVSSNAYRETLYIQVGARTYVIFAHCV